MLALAVCFLFYVNWINPRQDAASTAVPSESCYGAHSNVILLRCVIFCASNRVHSLYVLHLVLTIFMYSLFFLLTLLWVILPSFLLSDCITLSALRCEGRERGAISYHEKVLVQRYCFPLLVMQLFTVGGQHHFVLLWGRQRAAAAQCEYSESAGSPFFSPHLHLHTYARLPRLPPPSLNTYPASQGWESSYCCLALIWCSDTHNAARYLPPHSKAKFIFQENFAYLRKEGRLATSSKGCLFCLHCDGKRW